MNTAEYIVKQETVIAMNGKPYFVSTVNLNRYGYVYSETLPFETMVFDGDDSLDLYCDRYATRAQAEAGHANAVRNINSLLGLDTSGNI